MAGLDPVLLATTGASFRTTASSALSDMRASDMDSDQSPRREARTGGAMRRRKSGRRRRGPGKRKGKAAGKREGGVAGRGKRNGLPPTASEAGGGPRATYAGGVLPSVGPPRTTGASDTAFDAYQLDVDVHYATAAGLGMRATASHRAPSRDSRGSRASTHSAGSQASVRRRLADARQLSESLSNLLQQQQQG